MIFKLTSINMGHLSDNSNGLPLMMGLPQSALCEASSLCALPVDLRNGRLGGASMEGSYSRRRLGVCRISGKLYSTILPTPNLERPG